MRTDKYDHGLSPGVWLGHVLDWFEWQLRELRNADDKRFIRLWIPYSESYVIKDGDLSRNRDDLMDRYLEPSCKAILDQMLSGEQAPITLPRDGEDSGQVTVTGQSRFVRAEVSMWYDARTAGTRVRIIAERI